MTIQSATAHNRMTAPDRDWWRGAVIYQVYPRSFQDSNGDGVGDLLGIVERMPYIASLGVDAVWISPFFTSPMKDFGYDVSDYCDVDPMFGSIAETVTLWKATVGIRAWGSVAHAVASSATSAATTAMDHFVRMHMGTSQSENCKF